MSALVTPAQAAELLRVSPSSIYRAIRRGAIQATQGRPIRIPAAELQRLLEARGLRPHRLYAR